MEVFISEFIKCWTSRKRSRLSVNGMAFVNFSVFLGNPFEAHSPHSTRTPHPQRRYPSTEASEKNKTQYFRLRLYDSDFNALSAFYLLSDCSLIALWLFSDCSVTSNWLLTDCWLIAWRFEPERWRESTLSQTDRRTDRDSDSLGSCRSQKFTKFNWAIELSLHIYIIWRVCLLDVLTTS